MWMKWYARKNEEQLVLGFLYSMVLIPARNAVFPGSLVWTKLLIQECHRRCVFTGLVGGDRFPVGSCCPQPWVCTRAKEATCNWQTAKWFPKTDGYILTVHDPFFSELACQRSSTNITNMLSFFLSFFHFWDPVCLRSWCSRYDSLMFAAQYIRRPRSGRLEQTDHLG